MFWMNIFFKYCGMIQIYGLQGARVVKLTLTQMIALFLGTLRFLVAVAGFIPHLQVYRKKINRS